MMMTRAYAVQGPAERFAPFEIERRDPGPTDVAIDILYCGICHTDLHVARAEWPGSLFPCVPGHEIIGRVTRVGPEVTRFSPGDIVGVGCMVGSCGTCAGCAAGHENYCEHEHGFIQTYNGGLHGGTENTYGGYSAAIVVDEHFVFAIRHAPHALAGVAPLLCAGATTWSPLRRWNAGPGSRVGVVGVGGLGHMGIRLAHALGAQVVAFTTSAGKRRAALDLGAHEAVLWDDAAAMQARRGSFDLILDTVAAAHDLDRLMPLLRTDATMVLLGVPEHPHPSPSVVNLVFRRRSLAGSLIGGVGETQEMLDFCAQRGITADVEMVAVQDIEVAFERLRKGDVRYRFVIDMATLGEPAGS